MSSVVVAVQWLDGAPLRGVVERVVDAAIRQQVGPKSAGLVECERVGRREAEGQVYPDLGCWPDRIGGDLPIL